MKRKSSTNPNSASNANLMDTGETIETEETNADDKDDTFAPAYTYYNTSFSSALWSISNDFQMSRIRSIPW